VHAREGAPRAAPETTAGAQEGGGGGGKTGAAPPPGASECFRCPVLSQSLDDLAKENMALRAELERTKRTLQHLKSSNAITSMAYVASLSELEKNSATAR
jgi:hypothetical protein